MKVNLKKYTDIAVLSPRGILLQSLIKAHWDQWIDIVNKLPNLLSYKIEMNRMYWYRGKLEELRPRNQKDTEILAEQIFSWYVWGISMENWQLGTILAKEQGVDFFMLDDWLEHLCYDQAQVLTSESKSKSKSKSEQEQGTKS